MDIEHSPVSRRNFLQAAALVAGGALLTGCGLGEINPSRPDTTSTPSEIVTPTHPTTPPSARPTPRPSHRTSEPSTEPTPTPTIRTIQPPPNNHPELPSDRYIRRGPTNRPYYGFTIDDWYSYDDGKIKVDALDYLRNILEIAREKHALITFFPTGLALDQFVANYGMSATRKAWRQILTDGHVIGNHTDIHDTNLAALTNSLSYIRNQFSRQQDKVNAVLGWRYDEFLVRPPGGSGGFPTDDPNTLYNRQNLHLQAALSGLSKWITMWTTDSNDSKGRIITPGATMTQEDTRFLHIMSSPGYEQVGNGSIVLGHPQTISPDGVSTMFDMFADQGLKSRTVPGLFTAR